MSFNCLLFLIQETLYLQRVSEFTRFRNEQRKSCLLIIFNSGDTVPPASERIH